MPSDLKGETFSRVFNANQASLERFLVSRKVKGPCWMEIKNAVPAKAPISWCKVEATVEKPVDVTVLQGSAVPPPPPLTVVALNVKTTINPRTHLNEISMVSCLEQDNVWATQFHPEKSQRAGLRVLENFVRRVG